MKQMGSIWFHILQTLEVQVASDRPVSLESRFRLLSREAVQEAIQWSR